MPVDAVEVGRVLDAWGVQGWFKVLPFSSRPEALFSSKRWWLQSADIPAATYLLRLRQAREHSDTVVAQADGVDDRDTAEALKGARIFVPRSSFPTPAPDEYYWVDLIGLKVVNREGLPLGLVRDLLSTGPQTVLVISDATADPPRERMIPFVAAYVDAVDIADRVITVDWQPDYDH